MIRNFLIYTINETIIESKKVLELTENETLHTTSHSENSILNSFLSGVDILLARGIGNGLINVVFIKRLLWYYFSLIYSTSHLSVFFFRT